jgi:hypothetical protein
LKVKSSRGPRTLPVQPNTGGSSPPEWEMKLRAAAGFGRFCFWFPFNSMTLHGSSMQKFLDVSLEAIKERRTWHLFGHSSSPGHGRTNRILASFSSQLTDDVPEIAACIIFSSFASHAFFQTLRHRL